MAFTKSQLEIFVETYLKSLKSHLVKRSDRKYIQKAINMIIAITTDSPCCTNPDDTIELFTPFDNKLTSTVRELLQKIDRRKHKQSIQRTVVLLQKVIYDACCGIIVTPVFESIDTDCSNSAFVSINGVPILTAVNLPAQPNIYQVMVDALNALYNPDFKFYLYFNNAIGVITTLPGVLSFTSNVNCE